VAAAVADTLQKTGLASCLRSRMSKGEAVKQEVLLVDTFGELPALYALADAVILGGSFSYRWKAGFGQNIVEPLIAGKPVLHGPFVGQFEDITERLRGVWPGTQVEGVDALVSSLEQLIAQPSLRERLAAEARAIVAANSDNARRHVAFILDALQPRAPISAVSPRGPQ
jgi:3-deoxy-D-manno-octulosonic-acid transferase